MEKQKNIIVLRTLLADSENIVRVKAAISLIVLGENIGEKMILGALNSGREWEKNQILEQFARISEIPKWDFARPAVSSISSDLSLSGALRKRAKKLLDE